MEQKEQENNMDEKKTAVSSGDEYEVIDLSDMLDGNRSDSDDEDSEEFYSSKPKSGMYNFIIRYSGGCIRDEKQAQVVVIVLIIVLNLITFSMLSGK